MPPRPSFLGAGIGARLPYRCASATSLNGPLRGIRTATIDTAHRFAVRPNNTPNNDNGNAMTTKQPQHELFKAETTWFHVFKNMVDSGDVGNMGPHAVAVYVVVKSHTNFSTGRAFPSLDTIVEKSGVSLAQVKRSLTTLERLGYLTKSKTGRNNTYSLREKVEIQDAGGRPTHVATWDYLPSSVQAAVADLKNVLVTGSASDARMIHIERLTVNIAQAGGTVNNFGGAAIPAEARAKIDAILKACGR